jgi:hypothetical protein
MEEYCRDVVLNEQGGPNRYIVNRGGYALYCKEFGLRSFELMLELYEILASLHRTRVEMASKWLQANGLFVPVAEPWLIPHSLARPADDRK